GAAGNRRIGSNRRDAAPVDEDDGTGSCDTRFDVHVAGGSDRDDDAGLNGLRQDGTETRHDTHGRDVHDQPHVSPFNIGASYRATSARTTGLAYSARIVSTGSTRVA